MKKEIQILKNIQNSPKLIKLFYLEINSKKKLKTWISAARLETIPLSISGIIIGSFYSLFLEKFDIVIFILALLTAISFQVLSNFANDYGDGILGTDDNRIGPKRSIASGEISPPKLKKAILINIFISISLSCFLIKYSFGTNYYLLLIFLILSVFSIVAAIKYTMGKSPYGYKGLGDIFVFIFFGLVSVMGSSFLYSLKLDFNLLLLAISLGFFCVGVLNLNNIRDIENDTKMKKKTIPTRIGFKLSKYYHKFLIVLPFVLTIIWSNQFLIYDYAINGSDNVKENLEISYNHFLIILALTPFLFHLFKVHFAKTPDQFRPLLKQLALSVFLYSILIAIFLFNESKFF